ncbi:MAG: lipid-A-disaccharide synthase [Isosphaeraceae bacterium]|nr:lipid-A-disaccharide synthase [Isosphaeraceae bacterium]
MRIFISTGEPSGDLHAANLIHSLRRRVPDAEFVGFGGPLMEETGAQVLFPLVDLAVMWFVRVLLNLHKFIGLVSLADRYFRDNRPDAVVLIDYPGFNWHIARRAKERGIPVFYYVPPQIWAWGSWRVNKVRKFVDHVLCSLPFEPVWYHERNVPQAVYVGHPYFDELAERVLDESFLESERSKGGPVVAILPGSRTQEILKNLPLMLRAAKKVASSRPDARFVMACLRERHRELALEVMEREGIDVDVALHVGRTAELIRLADVAWAVSGSVGLELMVEALPSVILYKVKRIDLVIARRFIKSKYISLVNLLADREVMPEYLTGVDVSDELAGWALRWLNDPTERAKASATLTALRDRVTVPGASDRAAAHILESLAAKAASAAVRGPHGRIARLERDGSELER